MKPTDLMIGDWICVTKNFTQKYHQIRALSNDKEDVLKGIYINNYGVECNSIFSRNDIEPIPLTPEILEKNGFKSRKDGYDIGISLLYWDKYCTAVCGWTHCDDIIEVFDCRYVHQLQHALRLCGIDKEIEL